MAAAESRGGDGSVPWRPAAPVGARCATANGDSLSPSPEGAEGASTADVRRLDGQRSRPWRSRERRNRPSRKNSSLRAQSGDFSRHSGGGPARLREQLVLATGGTVAASLRRWRHEEKNSRVPRVCFVPPLASGEVEGPVTPDGRWDPLARQVPQPASAGRRGPSGAGKQDREPFLGEVMIVGQYLGKAQRSQGDHRAAIGQAVPFVGSGLIQGKGGVEVARVCGSTSTSGSRRKT